MNALEIAILKDSILTYLAKNPESYIELDVIKKDLKINNIPGVVLKAYLNEMCYDRAMINIFDRNDLLIITEKGQKLLIEGGYSASISQLEEDKQIVREKTKLEIQNLKLTKWLSIIALLISILALWVSIFK